MLERGERGPRGDHGQTGDVGPAGPEGKSSFLTRNVTLSFWAIVLASVLLIGVMGYQMREIRHFASENRERIRQINEQREETRIRFQRSDASLCLEVEKLKAQNRQDALEQFRNLDRTLRILGIEKTPEIVDVATENRDADLKRNKARVGGCGELPSVNGK